MRERHSEAQIEERECGHREEEEAEASVMRPMALWG